MTQESQRDPARDIGERGLTPHVGASPVVGTKTAIKAIPLGGLRLWWYTMKVMFGKPDEDQRMPRSKGDQKQIDEVIHPEALAEKARRDEVWLSLLEEAHCIDAEFDKKERLDQERSERHENIVTLRNSRRRSMTVFVGNQSGDGSKTTTCGYLALTFRAILLGLPVVIVECRRDSAQGVDKHKLDAEKVVSIREFHRRYKAGELNDEQGALSTELIMDALQLSEGGIFYLQADLNTPLDDKFDGEAASEVIRVLKTTGAIIIIDSGNNPSDPITIGMANESALGVYPTMPTAKSLTMRLRTLETFNVHLKSTILADSISVLSALQPHHSVDELWDRMGPFTRRDRLFVTEFDLHMKDDPVSGESNNGTKIADLELITLHNRDEFEKMVEELLSIFVHQPVNGAHAGVRAIRPSQNMSGSTALNSPSTTEGSAS